MSELLAGWSKVELRIPPRYPMAGYIARKGVSSGTLDPLHVRALVLKQGGLAVGIVVAEILLVPNAWAGRLRPRLARILDGCPECFIIAATHTHSGPQIDASPFNFSSQTASARENRALMHLLEECITVATARAAQSLQPVETSFARIRVRGVATDRNHPGHAKTQPLCLFRFKGKETMGLFGVYGCHSTVLGHENLMLSGDLHGEISRLLEGEADVALIAAGAAANISTRFTRREQSVREMRRLAADVTRQAQAAHLRPLPQGKLAFLSQNIQLPVADFDKPVPEKLHHSARIAAVAKEGMLIRKRLSRAREFSHGEVTAPLSLLRIGGIGLAAVPFEIYSDTGEFLWRRARVIPLCYANGYWGYITSQAAGPSDYEAISSPFADGADEQFRRVLISLSRGGLRNGRSRHTVT
ncbi:MAG: hypothetical protein KGM47_17510 [Acidobacteriota bacterium]|nr:hypothetical protein [Acidobacteriota bacterium]